MPASEDFFGQRNAQAVLKHGVLTRYAYYFAGRAGSAAGGRVAFIDGYAGEGRYDDGSPGSPLLLASQAERAKTLGRDVKLAFVEQDGTRRARLSDSLHDHQVVPDQLLGGALQQVIDDLLQRYDDRAVLLFADPFGLAMDRATFEAVLGRSVRGRPIDVLYHFSLSSVARMGRAGITEGPATEENASRLDTALGSIGWRDLFEGATGKGEPTHAALDTATLFRESVEQSTGMRSLGIPVRQRPSQLPKYLLILFSANDQARWDFADLAGKAHVDWLHHCDAEDFDAFVRKQDAAGMIPLFAEPRPEADDAEESTSVLATEYLTGHLKQLFRTRGSVRAVDDVADVYGEMLGRARVTHVRTVIKGLHSSGLIDDDGKGKFWLRTISWRGD